MVYRPPPRRVRDRVFSNVPWPEYPEFPDEPDSGGSGGAGHDTSYDRRTNVGSTILGAVLGPVYGKRRVPGFCYFTYDYRSVWSDYWGLGYAFAVGESVNIEDTELNNRRYIIASINKGLGTNDADNQPGDFSTLISYMPGLVNVGTRYRRDSMPGSINLTAVISGKKIHDFRDPTYPSDTTTNHANPALIAFDICTDLEMWKGLDVLEVNTDQLEQIADWCDEQVSSEERWHFHGRVDIRDSDKALAYVLRHCFTTPYVYNQTMYFVADMPPHPLDDTWTNTGTTFDADSASGNATSLEAGDVVIAYDSGTTYLMTLASTPSGDDQFVVTSNPGSLSGVIVRPITNLHFQQDDYVIPPSGVDQDFAQAPDVVIAKYPQGDDGDWATVRCEDPDGYTAGDPRMREITVNGAKTASVAARWGHQERRSWKFCPFQWEMVLGPEASELAPGDIFRMSTEDGLSGTLVRCMTKKESFLSGAFEVRVRQFNMATYYDDTATGDSAPDDYYDPPDLPDGGDGGIWEPVTSYNPGADWQIVFDDDGNVVMARG